MESTFKYRVLKSSWGIAIDVTANFVFDTPVPESVKITDHIYVAFDSFTLSEEYSVLVIKGVKMMADHISDGEINLPVTVQLTDLWFNPCDFQADGIPWAVAGWIANELGISAPLVNITFDKTANRYVYKT